MWKSIAESIPVFGGYTGQKYFIKPIYEVSDKGEIRNKNTKKVLSQNISGGIKTITLSVKCLTNYGYKYENRYKMSVSRIVYQTFYGHLLNENCRVGHKDKNNNNCNSNNLYIY